jgi:hypothetical protein
MSRASERAIAAIPLCQPTNRLRLFFSLQQEDPNPQMQFKYGKKVGGGQLISSSVIGESFLLLFKQSK